MKTLKDRFWSKVIKTSNCWEWIGSKCNGYGQIYGNCRMYYTHRLAWELKYGKIPDGLCVLHHCDNPSCVRPNHLFLGTFGDNNRDSAMKGRNFLAIGESNGRSKLTEEDVLLIRKLHNQDNMTYRQLAKKFNVSPPTIGCVLRNETWKHIIS